MTLQEKLNAMKKASIAGKPPEIVAIMLKEVENLVQSGIADKAIKAGETLPDFSLPDEKGNIENTFEPFAKSIFP